MKKRGKRVLSMVVFAAIVLAACGQTAKVTAKANPETDFRRKENDRGGITITGYVGSSKTVVIPSRLDGKPVTDIGKEAFEDNELTSVIIPNSVTIIGAAAFADNELTSIIIPNSVTRIGSGALAYNPLTSITIGDNVDIPYSRGDPYATVYAQNGRKAGRYYEEDGTIHVP